MPFAIFIDGDKLGSSPGGPGGSTTWGSITGTLSSQTDLQSALNGKSDTGHTHAYNTLTGIPSTFAIEGFTASTSTTSPNNTINASQLLSLASGVTGDFVITPKGGGAIQTQIADNTLVGGNKRGLRATDFQRTRANADEVASGQDSFIGAGHANKATNSYSVVVGGQSNTASGIYSFVGGGGSNTAGGANSFVGGGSSNTASGGTSFVGGGSSNTAGGTRSTIGGGSGNTVNNSDSFIGAGQGNLVSGTNASIIAGIGNAVQGQSSTIIGGRGLTLSGDLSFGFLSNLGSNPMTVSAANTAVLGNVDLWLASNDNTPRSLRFYGQYGASGDFPNTVKYVGFRAPNSITADVLWTLPNADGTNGQVLQTNGSGTLSWATVTATITGFTPSSFTSSPNNTINAARMLVNVGSVNGDFVVQPKGTGSILAQLPDAAATGGNKRGTQTVDLQMQRSSAAQVASGAQSFIGAGSGNSVTGIASAAFGQLNAVNSNYGFAAGSSSSHPVSGNYTYTFGNSNSISSNNNFTAGTSNILQTGQHMYAFGSGNWAENNFATVFGQRGLSYTQGQTIFSNSNGITFRGTSQASIIILRGTSTGTGAAVIGNDQHNGIPIPSGKAMAVDLTIIGKRRTDSGLFVMRRYFTVCNNAGSSFMLGGAMDTIGTDRNNGLAGVSVTIAVNDTTDLIEITAFGVVSTTIDFTCTAITTDVFTFA